MYCTCAHHDMLRESKICLPPRSHDGDKEHWDNKVFVNDELSSNWNPLCVRLDLDELQPSELLKMRLSIIIVLFSLQEIPVSLQTDGCRHKHL